MRSLNKRGIELAASTVVILLVAIVILGMAFTLTYKALCAAVHYSNTVDSQTQNQIDRLLAGGGRVVVADNSKTAKMTGSPLCGGSSQKTAMFAIGIKNTGASMNSFKINVIAANPKQEGNGQIQYFTDTLDIKPGQTKYESVLITPPTNIDAKQFIYTVTVDEGTSTVYGVQHLYVSLE